MISSQKSHRLLMYNSGHETHLRHVQARIRAMETYALARQIQLQRFRHTSSSSYPGRSKTKTLNSDAWETEMRGFPGIPDTCSGVHCLMSSPVRLHELPYNFLEPQQMKASIVVGEGKGGEGRGHSSKHSPRFGRSGRKYDG